MKQTKYNLRSRSGISLVEMLVAMLIMAIFCLGLHFISRIAIATPRRHEREMKMSADAAYGFKLMQKHVRESADVLDPDTPGGSWVGERLVIVPPTGPNKVFGLYNNAGASSVDLFFMEDVTLNVDNVNNRKVLMSVQGPWTVTFDPNVTEGKTVDATVQVRDENNRLIYDVSTKAVRRI